MFKSIKEKATAEVVEKKSKFIANVFYVESREEAEEGKAQERNEEYARSGKAGRRGSKSSQTAPASCGKETEKKGR